MSCKKIQEMVVVAASVIGAAAKNPAVLRDGHLCSAQFNLQEIKTI